MSSRKNTHSPHPSLLHPSMPRLRYRPGVARRPGISGDIWGGWVWIYQAEIYGDLEIKTRHDDEWWGYINPKL